MAESNYSAKLRVMQVMEPNYEVVSLGVRRKRVFGKREKPKTIRLLKTLSNFDEDRLQLTKAFFCAKDFREARRTQRQTESRAELK